MGDISSLVKRNDEKIIGKKNKIKGTQLMPTLRNLRRHKENLLVHPKKKIT